MAKQTKGQEDVSQLALYYLSEPEETAPQNVNFKIDELRQRAQALAVAAPLLRIIAQNETEPVSLLDPYTIAMSAVGHVIDGLQLMNLGESSLTVKDFEEMIAADITSQYKALKSAGRILQLPKPEEVKKTAGNILDKLLSRKEGGVFIEKMYQPQSQEYSTYEYRLFDQYYDDVEGILHIRPTPEAANLYLNSLGQPLGDMQAALTALVERQIAKGDMASAIKTASQHLNLTRQHRSEILNLRRQIQRNASGIHWLESIKPELDKIYDDVPYLLSQDEKIYNSLSANTHVMLSDKGQLARKVLGIISNCSTIYRKLKIVVVALPDEYRQARVQEGFFSSTDPLPHLEQAILRPVIQDFSGAMLLEIESAILACTGLTTPKCMDFNILAEKLTAPRREVREYFDPMEVTQVEGVEIEDIRNISETGRKLALTALQSIGAPRTISDIIQRMEEDSDSPDVGEALLLYAMRAWRDDGYAGITATKTGNRFSTCTTAGDEFMVQSIAELEEEDAA